MKIARRKIEEYISQTLSIYSQTGDEKNKQQFSLNHVINIAVSTCVMLNKSKTVKCSLPKNSTNVLGNSAKYLQVFTALLNTVAKYTDQEIHLRLDLIPIDDSKVKCLLIVSVDGNDEETINLPTSLNYKLNYNLFIVRKLLNKIKGEFYIHNKDDYAVDFIIDVNLNLGEQDDDSGITKPFYRNSLLTQLKPSPNNHSLNQHKKYSSALEKTKEEGNKEDELLKNEIATLFSVRQDAIQKSIKLKNKIKQNDKTKKYKESKSHKQNISFNKVFM